MSRHAYSAPPRISVPYRWTMKAIRTSLEGGHHRGETLLDDGVAEIDQAPPLAGENRLARIVLDGEHAQQLRGVRDLFRRKFHAAAAQGVGRRGGAGRA